jgi:hypothetical protein
VRIAALRLQQRDSRTCGPSVAVVAGAMLSPGYRSALSDTEAGRLWFAEEQGRVHAQVNRAWPRALGTTPLGMARALTLHSRGREVRYRWRLWRGRRDPLADVLDAVGSDWPVPMLIGRVIPRHWVLIIDASADLLQCYEPSSGEVRAVAVAAVRRAQLRGLGFPRPFAFVLPSSATRSATA